MRLALFVALGAAVGGVLRYVIATYVIRHTGVEFPTSTLVINVTGSFVLGALVALSLGGSVSPEMRALLATGFCGGFTTFSTFSVETVALLEAGLTVRAVSYVLASLVLSVLAGFLGMLVVRR